MKKLLLLSLLFLTGCVDRYSIVRDLELEFPGVNAESFVDDVYILTKDNKSVMFQCGKGYRVKVVNVVPEKDLIHCSTRDELYKELHNQFDTAEK